MGALQIPGSEELVIFGGFNQQALDRVMIYKTEGEGHFEEAGKLQESDFFMVNGCYIQSQKDNIMIFAGDRYMHKFDIPSRTFTTLEKRQ
jgi:hypothetical protein